MKKLGIAFLLMLLVTAVMALPAAAKPKEPVGTQLNILSTATHHDLSRQHAIPHSPRLGEDPTTEAVGHFSFALDLDGMRLSEDFVLEDPGGPRVPGQGSFIQSWVFNFPDGLTGTHVFTGHFFAPCYVTPGPCDKPNEVVEAVAVTRTVIFG